MPQNDIGLKFKLQGEKEFSKGIRDAAANVRELDSRMKAVREEYKLTGDQQKFNAEQTEILTKKIEEQQRIVKAAEDALKYLSANGVDQNDKRMQSWRITLNNATASLNRMQAELKSSSSAADNAADNVQRQAKALEKSEEAADGYAEKLANIDKNISFSTAREKLTLVKDLVSEILSGVLDIGKGIWEYESLAAQWATETKKAAAEAGVDPAVYQSYKYAAEMLGMSIDDYKEMAKELENSMMSTDEDVALAFNELGVVYRNEDGTLKNAFTVLSEVALALGSVNTETNKQVLASKLLGSEYKKLNPLIIEGGDAWAHYLKEGEEMGTVSEAAFNALNSLNQSRLKLANQFDTIKKEAAGRLAPGFQSITEGLSGLLTQFDEFLESEKGEAAISKINGFLTKIGDTIGNVDVGDAVDKFFAKFESVDLSAAISTVAEAVETFTDGLSWIIANSDTVVKTLGSIGSAYAAIKISNGVLEFLNLTKGGTGTGAGNTGTSSTGSGSGTSTGGGGGNVIPGNGFKKALSAVLTAAESGFVTVMPTKWVYDDLEEMRNYKPSGGYNTLTKKIEKAEETPEIKPQKTQAELEADAKLLEQALFEIEQNRINQQKAAEQAKVDAYLQSGKVSLSADMEDALMESLNFNAEEYVSGLLASIAESEPNVEEAVEESIIAPLSNFDSAVIAAGSAGSRVAEAYAAGIESRLWRVRSAVNHAALATQLPTLLEARAGLALGTTAQGGNVYMDGYLVGEVVNNNLGMSAAGR